MYLKKLHISNFRCFRDYTIEFAPGVTVLFGKNGSGKSTLIHAIHKALSMLMYTKNDYENVTVRGKRKKKLVGYKTITRNNPYLHTKGFANDDFNNLEDSFIEIAATADFGPGLTDVDWKMSAKANNSKLRPTEFEDAYLAFYDWQENSGQLPLLAYISDGFPHKEDNKKSQVKAKIRALRNFAYFDWDEEEGCTNEWILRLENNLFRQAALLAKGVVKNEQGIMAHAQLQEEDEPEFQELSHEQQCISECFSTFTSNSVFDSENAIKFNAFTLGRTKQNEGKLCIQTAQGEEYDFRKLPAGYKRLFNIVLDLAYRSYILSEKSTTNNPGLVIIDEIDLHLHPQLEQVVLQCFQRAFHHVQFIVSTHSPLVLTDIETQNSRNRVLKMTPACDAPEEWRNIHGIDYNQMLEENMDVSKRKPEIQELFDKAWSEVAEKDTGAAKETVAELERITPKDQIELVKLRSLISRLEIIGK
ncbi:AAA family ATPase [Hallella faecis]|uniref:AAA family ATPase n=1 Tax=Hallella faecis TaxID=2841596 RepID=A0ABV1FTA3_9BACT|nr:AAA family ATPase [Hallella faecis]MBU0290879.1 AAA family ATPase [Hallella faecis]